MHNSPVKNPRLCEQLLAEREEILRYRWLESEKAGHDIGSGKAIFEWIVKYRSAWLAKRGEAAPAGVPVSERDASVAGVALTEEPEAINEPAPDAKSTEQQTPKLHKRRKAWRGLISRDQNETLEPSKAAKSTGSPMATSAL